MGRMETCPCQGDMYYDNGNYGAGWGYGPTTTTKCKTCSGTGNTSTIIKCSHNKTNAHYYCNTSGCTYTGSSNHCVHRKTAQHDN